MSFEDIFKFRGKKKSRAEVRWIAGLGNQECLLMSKILDWEGSVTWGIVMMEHPFVYNVWSHANDTFSEPIEDIFIKKNLVDSLFWRNKFCVEDSLSVKNKLA